MAEPVHLLGVCAADDIPVLLTANGTQADARASTRTPRAAHPLLAAVHSMKGACRWTSLDQAARLNLAYGTADWPMLFTTS